MHGEFRARLVSRAGVKKSHESVKFGDCSKRARLRTLSAAGRDSHKVFNGRWQSGPAQASAVAVVDREVRVELRRG